jgi:hypothetical protein
VPGLKFILRPESFCVHRLPPDAAPRFDLIAAAPWYSVTRTHGELSVIAPEGVDPGPGARQPGWSCFQIDAVLDFSMLGVIAGVAGLLADARISMLAVSTHDTDCFLVRSAEADAAASALAAAGHSVRRER